MADAPTKADITAADGAKIVIEAGTWQDTDYAPDTSADKYKGAGAVKNLEADCSGSVWKIYGNVGYRYEYTRSRDFDLYVRRLNSPFRKLGSGETPQVGDIVLYPGHMSVYAGDSMIWSAHKTGYVFGKFPVMYFGPPTGYYRYQVDAARK